MLLAGTERVLGGESSTVTFTLDESRHVPGGLHGRRSPRSRDAGAGDGFVSETNLPDDSERTAIVADPIDTEVEHEQEHAPRGTMVIVFLFLAMAVFMFGWAYVLLIVRG